MIKKYRLGFNVWGLILFIAIMVPNFIWFAFPAPNDILRADSSTKILDTIASVSQVIMIIFLCAIVNKQCKKIKWSPLILASCICCLIYFAAWGFYYAGVTNALVILSLCLIPCLAFLFFAIDRKNMIAVIPAVIFTFCHLVYGIVNFII
ncbi:MAG: hypothetical protein QM793_06945 [Muricomes sp.]